MGRISKRDRVLDAAEALFEKQGFVATGVNQITQVANVASMTLYNNFRNKDELILAMLERRSVRLMSRIEEKVDKAGNDPVERILAVFDALDLWVGDALKKTGDFTGCTFVKAAVEFGGNAHPAHRAATNHKLKIIGLFEDNARRLGRPDSYELAKALHLLCDGAITQAQLLSDDQSVKRAREIAQGLLRGEPAVNG